MKGSIQKRGPDSYRLVIYEGVDPATNKKKYSFIPFKGTKRAAQSKLAELVASKAQGAYVLPSVLTLEGYLSQWLDEWQARVGGKTFNEYRQKMTRYVVPSLGKTPLQKVGSLAVQRLYRELQERGGVGGTPLSAQTVTHVHRILNKAMRQAVRWQLIPRNPLEGVDAPTVRQKEMQTLAPEQAKQLIAAAEGTAFYGPLVVFLASGARRGEVAGLMWTDIDLDGATLTIRRSVEQVGRNLRLKEPKSGKLRVVTIPGFLVTVLRKQKAEQAERRLLLGEAYKMDHGPLVFPNEDGTLRTPDSLTRAFARLLQKAGLTGLRLHDCRHSFATILIEAGQDAKTVSAMLGHSDIRTTLNIYARATSEMQKEAAQKLDRLLGS